MTPVDVLVVVGREDASRYYKNLSAYQDFKVQLVSDLGDALAVLADRNQHVDVLVVDNKMGHTFEFINELRLTYPRLFIVLVDEEADFGLPGQADEISTEPFTNDDLIRRINRLMSDRQLETLRADSLPAVRQFAKELRNATGELGKQQAAVAACKNLGYAYVAFYRLDSSDPLQLSLKAQDGPALLQGVAPRQAGEDDLIGWVAQNGQSRIAGPTDALNHLFVAKGRLGAVACVPVLLGGSRYGVLVACREQPGSISQENVLMLELVSAQLAAAISKEIVV
ncbi:MAG: GAF domain-containing protein [Chloroflexi bacterium]|nr:GAF domain-containing protein [Chloroflexota bacterium]